MLTLAGTKTAIFFNKSSDKFKPLNENKSRIYCSEKNKTKRIEDLTSEEIIEFVKDFI